MRLILSSNPYRDRGLRAALNAREILEGVGVETALCLPFDYNPNERSERIEMPKGVQLHDLEAELPHADMIVCFGGDGTILHTARSAISHNLPVLGVNMGSVGFIAELERGELQALTRLPQGDYTIEERMLLRVCVYRGKHLVSEDLALNDAVFSNCAVSRVADMEILTDGVLATRITGDGVIVCTPTGSTAYSMAAGGPIVEPTSREIIITPICPHHFTARAMVLDSRRTVTVRIPRGSRKRIQLCVDGDKPLRLAWDERVEISRAVEVARLVRLHNRNFYQLLSKKLGGAIK